MTESALLERIDEVSTARRAAWSAREVGRAAELGEELRGLYDDLREERARARSGDRKEIAKRARIDMEFERFIADLI